MATVQSLGLGSGLDIDGIITALVDAEKVPRTTQLDTREAELTAKISALGTVKSRLTDIDSALSSLGKSSTYSTYTATSSDTSVFTASPTTLAQSGTYSIEVISRAQGHTLASQAYASVNDTIGTGTLTLDFGTTDYTEGTDTYNSFTANSSLSQQVITIDSSNNTLSSMRDYLNAGDYNVSASIVNDGSGYRLLLTSDSGEKNSMRITVVDDDGDNLDTVGLSTFAFNSSATSAEQTLAGADTSLTVNGLSITSTDTTLSEAIPGITLNISGADAGSTKTLTITQDTSQIKTQIESLVEAYNAFNTSAQEFSAFVGIGSEENGILLGDVTLRSIQSQLRSTMLSQVTGLSGSVTALADLGILTNQNTGDLEIDDATLDSKIAANFDDIREFFTPDGRPTDSLVSYVSSTNDTVAGTYAVNITQMATQATLNGNGNLPDFSMGGSVVVDNDNNTLKVRLNGILSSTITLTNGTYTNGNTLAAEIQSQINADATLTEQGLTASVSYDSSNNRFTLKSTTFGSNSTFAITAVGTNSNAELGLSVAQATDGVDVSGTINGEEAGGNGQYLTSSSGNAKGLRLSIIGGTTGDRGTVSYTRGLTDQIETLIESLTETNGSIDQKTSGLNRSLDDVSTSREQLDLQMDSLEARLLAQFSAMDALVSQLNSISGFLTSTLATLPGASSQNEG
ncbi:MAG: flagellar filament capping protein FliD [Gammaproteobacteria bacterium]